MISSWRLADGRAGGMGGRVVGAGRAGWQIPHPTLHTPHRHTLRPQRTPMQRGKNTPSFDCFQ
ncbi:hypothetical protein E2C01_042372 [Portunus trituberculatus]|uniref:Uncharacterized protein n=1 Tax=Portunus trituberculatus TaxID=210409 RepID=A0A5B7FTG2_PORTR|nr:hypothetical protein [Portunus trituberculatus]